MMERFFALGECMVEIGARGPDGKHSIGYAGDTFNTAWYMRRQAASGTDIGYLTAVGSDRVSSEMVSAISSHGVGTDHIARLDDRIVGLYMIHLDDGERSFSYWRNQSAAKAYWRHLPDVDVIGGSGSWLHLSGISVAITEAEGRETLERFLSALKATGTVISFDPNIRVTLWDESDDMRAQLMAFASCADIVLPSLDEEISVFGDANAYAVADRYLANGTRYVAIKNGDEAGLFADKNGRRVAFQPPSVDVVVDTTAAGDSFNAGFLNAFANGADGADACKEGAKLAAHVIGRYGALVP